MYEQGTYEPVITTEAQQIPQEQMSAPTPVNVQQTPVPAPAPQKELSVISTEKKYESILQQEYDGQISLSLPDTEMVERQITGQLNLDDILNGFEDRKKEADRRQEEERKLEKQRRREEQRKALNQTNDIMSQLAGVIPGSTTGTLPSGRILTLEEEYGGNLSRIREEDTRAMEEAAKNEAVAAPVPEPITEEEVITAPEEVAAETAPVSEETAEPVAEEVTAAPEPVPAEEPVAEQVMQEEEIPAEEPVAEPVVQEEVIPSPEPEEVMAEAVPVSEMIAEPVMQEEVIPSPEPAAEPIPQEETIPGPEAGYIPQAEMPEPAPDPMAAFQGMDFGEVEEIEDIEQPDDLDDMLKTSNMPVGDIERLAQAKYEAGIETEDDEPRRRNHPSYMTLEEAVRSRRDFNEDEKRIFIRFEGIEPLKAQIVDAMDTLSMEAYHGNVIVTGADNSGRRSLALDIVKAIQSRDSSFSGKVAKISGEALNKKNIPITIKKLHNGALIVENAGGLTLESVNIITDALRQETEPVLVVLEGSGESMLPIIHGSRYMPEVFDARIDIAPYTNDDLVAYGRGYAKEKEYSIDDMGVLALYTRIGEMQSLDHQVSIEEVREIVDAAIRHVDRKNMAHFMDVLLAKRYDDDDYIVLREKDFIL